MKIRIHNEATVNATGRRANRNSKAVVRISPFKIYASELDAAADIGVHFSAISATVHGKCKTCKGYRFCLLSDLMSHLDEVSEGIQSMEESAKKWDELTAKQEAERKAREDMQNKLEAYKARHMMLVAHEEKYSKSLEKARHNHSMVLKQLEETSKEISELEEKLANGGSN